MANLKQQQFDEFKRVGNMLRGFLEVSQELANVGSIEQAISEADTRLEQRRKSEELLSTKANQEAEQLIADAKAQAEEIRKNADSQMVRALAQGASSLKNAQGQADTIISDARAQASTIISEAHSTASQHVTAAQTEAASWAAKVPAARENVNSLTRQIQEKQATVDNLDKEISIRDKQLAEINTQIAALRAKF